MSAYFPTGLWLLSGLICAVIAKRRHVKTTAFRQIVVALLGPLAIPLMLAAKPDALLRA